MHLKKSLNTIFLLILILFIFLAFFSFGKDQNNSSASSNKPFITNFESLFKPFFIGNSNLNLEANIALAVLSDEEDKKILYEKNLEEKSAIASLTKLMTAVIVIENYPLDSIIQTQYESFSVENLLKIMLIESNNDVAEYLAQKISRKNFIILMNQKAKELKMKSTSFINPTGLDESNGSHNDSSAKDIMILVSYIIENHPLIQEILSQETDSIVSEEGKLYNLENTNILLKEIPYQTWGKTGYTEIANGCLILMTKTPKGDTIINIIINTDERFTEMKRLIEWTSESFVF